MTLWTAGHGNRQAEELVALLSGADIEVVADVRRFPASRRNPQFNRGPLAVTLAGAGVEYQWWGEVLGGRREPVEGPRRHPAWRDPALGAYADHMDRAEFRATFSQLLSLAAKRHCALLCAETRWWNCHRRLMSDAAELRGTSVIHLVSPGCTAPHRLHQAVRRGDDGWPVYDVGVPLELRWDGYRAPGRGTYHDATTPKGDESYG